MSEDLKEKIEHLGWLATYDFKDYREKEERLRKTSDIFGNIPTFYFSDPLFTEKELLQTWRHVFATLFDCNYWNVSFAYDNDRNRYEINVKEQCIYYLEGSHGDNS